MAQGDATIGYGATLAVNDGSGGSFVAVEAITKLGVASYSVNMVESKRLENDIVKIIAGIKKGEPFTVLMENTRAGKARFDALLDTRAEYQWRFNIPDDEGADEFDVPGIVQAVKPSEIEVEGITMLEVTVQVSDNRS